MISAVPLGFFISWDALGTLAGTVSGSHPRAGTESQNNALTAPRTAENDNLK